MKKFLIIISCVVVILAAIFIKFMDNFSYEFGSGKNEKVLVKDKDDIELVENYLTDDNVMLIIQTKNWGFRNIYDKGGFEHFILKVYYDGVVKKVDVYSNPYKEVGNEWVINKKDFDELKSILDGKFKETNTSQDAVDGTGYKYLYYDKEGNLIKETDWGYNDGIECLEQIEKLVSKE